MVEVGGTALNPLVATLLRFCTNREIMETSNVFKYRIRGIGNGHFLQYRYRSFFVVSVSADTFI